VPDSDPRTKITLRNVLNMSSGLYPVDDTVNAYVSGSPLGYFGRCQYCCGNSRSRHRSRARHTWNYENYDSLLGVYALKTVIGDYQKYPSFLAVRCLTALACGTRFRKSIDSATTS
jgi:CubicO group peptidase (beta-lactamase class C family)